MAKDNNRYTLTPLQRFASNTLYVMCRGFAILPRWVRYYIIEEILFFVLYYLIHYRYKVITTNLRNAFPHYDEATIRGIAKRNYRNLAEQIINTLSVTGASSQRMRKYLSFPEAKAYSEATKDNDVILMGGHHGCWEYFASVALYDSGHKLMCIYHPLQNSILDDLFKRMRHIDNSDLIPRDDSLRYFIKNRGGRGCGKHLAMGLIADQNPYRHKDSRWFRFLNQDTIFAEGGEQLARKLGIPVWFADMKWLRRGEYELHMELLYDGSEEVAEGEITERYVRRLEQQITDCPERWLWSHRRWKYKREE